MALALALLLYSNRGAFARGGTPARGGIVAATVALTAVAAGYVLDTTELLVDRPGAHARQPP